MTDAARPSAAAPAFPTENAVELAGVTYGYDPRRPVLRGIDMTIPRGKVVAIMGGSGCGKTTILRLIGGQLQPADRACAGRGPVGAGPGPRRAVRDAAQDRHAVPVRCAVHRPVRVREHRVPAARAHEPARRTCPRPGADEAQRGRIARHRAVAAVGVVGRHGAARGARSRHRARPDARALRRAVRRTRPHLARRRRTADPRIERCAGHHVHRRHARRLRIAEDRRLPLLRVRGSDHRAGNARRSAGVGGPVRAPVRRRRGRRSGAVPLSGARATSRSSPPMPADAIANGLRRVGAGAISRHLALGLLGALLRRRADPLAGRVPAPPSDAARDLFRRRAVARHHHGLGAVRRHGAGPAGLRHAEQVWRRRFARHLRRPVARAGTRTGRRRSAVREPRGKRDHGGDRPHEDDRAARPRWR